MRFAIGANCNSIEIQRFRNDSQLLTGFLEEYKTQSQVLPASSTHRS